MVSDIGNCRSLEYGVCVSCACRCLCAFVISSMERPSRHMAATEVLMKSSAFVCGYPVVE